MGGLEVTIYEYTCTMCGDDMEVEAPIGTAEHALPCSSCGGRALRVISNVAFFRGSANAEELWNPQLGIAHRTREQAAEHIKKVNDTEGSHLTLDI
jgi:putative FmdB family regulatory protein